MKLPAILLASLSATLVTPVSAIAQELDGAVSEPPAVEPSGYEQLIDAIVTGVDRERIIENQLVVVRDVWEADTNLAVLEENFPGLHDAMIDAMRPILLQTDAEMQSQFRPDFVAALTSAVTEEEASRIAEFYRSPIGAKLLSGLSQTTDLRQSIEQGVRNGGQLDMEDFDRDVAASSSKVAGSLSEAEQEQLVAMFRTEPALRKLPQVQQAMRPVRIEMEKASVTPERRQHVEQAIRAAAERHIASARGG